VEYCSKLGSKSVNDIVRRRVDEGVVWQMEVGGAHIEDYNPEKNIIRETVVVIPFLCCPLTLLTGP